MWEASERECPECGEYYCMQKRVGAAWGVGKDMEIVALACTRCHEEWLRISLMDDDGEERLVREVAKDCGADGIFEKLLARAFCADSIKK